MSSVYSCHFVIDDIRKVTRKIIIPGRITAGLCGPKHPKFPIITQYTKCAQLQPKMPKVPYYHPQCKMCPIYHPGVCPKFHFITPYAKCVQLSPKYGSDIILSPTVHPPYLGGDRICFGQKSEQEKKKSQKNKPRFSFHFNTNT